MDVGVRHVEAGNHQADAAALGNFVQRGGDGVGHGKQMRGGGRRQIVPAVGFLPRHHQQMPLGYRHNVHKRHTFAVAPNQARGDFARNDFAENTGHKLLLCLLDCLKTREKRILGQKRGQKKRHRIKTD